MPSDAPFCSPPQLRGATVLLTGALGFLGKVVLERLLASSKPARILLLLRPKHGYSAQERLAHAKTRPCFAHLPPSAWDIVVALEGDTESPGLGLSAAAAAAAAATTHVIHMAASVDFDLPLADAARANVVGALHVLEFARGCPRLKRLVHTSTAYVAWPDAADGLLGEPPPLDAALCERLAKCEVCDDSPSAIAPYPNTYAFTKRAAEQLLVARRGSVALTICRPSIISASLRHPLPGWIDSKAALAGVAFMMGGGIMRTIAARPGSPLDIVPVDFVAHSLLRAAAGAGVALPDDGGGGGGRTSLFSAAAPALLLPAVAGREQSLSIEELLEAGYSFKRYPQGPYSRGRRLERPQLYASDDPRLAPAIRRDLAALRWGRWWYLLLGLFSARAARAAAALAKGIVAMRRIHRAFPHFSHTPYRFDAAPNAVHAWDAGFDVRAYATHGVMHGVYHYLLRGPVPPPEYPYVS